MSIVTLEEEDANHPSPQIEGLVKRLGQPMSYRKAYGSDFVHILPTEMETLINERREAADALEAQAARMKEKSETADKLLSTCHILESRIAILEAKLSAFREAIDQALDDMGDDGYCVCPACKDLMRAVLHAELRNKEEGK